MKTISKLLDLEPYGIIMLTGEADNLGLRCLCDLTAKGKALVCETFGLCPYSERNGFNDSWNSGDAANPHIASMLLGYDTYQMLGILALITVDKCHTVLITDQGLLFGLETGETWHEPELVKDEKLDKYVPITPAKVTTPDWDADNGVPWPVNTYGEVKRVVRFNHHHPHVGTRNVHSMSGRTH